MLHACSRDFIIQYHTDDGINDQPSTYYKRLGKVGGNATRQIGKRATYIVVGSESWTIPRAPLFQGWAAQSPRTIAEETPRSGV